MISKTILPLRNTASGIFTNGYTRADGIFFIYDPVTTTIARISEIRNASNGIIRNAADAQAGCRESFSSYWQMCEYSEWLGFYIYNYQLNVKAINRFFVLLKKQLGLTEKVIVYATDRSSFSASTPSHSAIVIKVPPFWLANGLRRGLFTLFLRCAALYATEGGTLDSAFRQYSLLSSIRPAIDLFLGGHVWPTVDYTTNVCAGLANQSDERLKILLRTEEVPFARNPRPSWAPAPVAAPQPAPVTA